MIKKLVKRLEIQIDDANNSNESLADFFKLIREVNKQEVNSAEITKISEKILL